MRRVQGNEQATGAAAAAIDWIFEDMKVVQSDTISPNPEKGFGVHGQARVASDQAVAVVPWTSEDLKDFCRGYQGFGRGYQGHC